jgi:hypothetical protein
VLLLCSSYCKLSGICRISTGIAPCDSGNFSDSSVLLVIESTHKGANTLTSLEGSSHEDTARHRIGGIDTKNLQYRREYFTLLCVWVDLYPVGSVGAGKSDGKVEKDAEILTQYVQKYPEIYDFRPRCNPEIKLSRRCSYFAVPCPVALLVRIDILSSRQTKDTGVHWSVGYLTATTSATEITSESRVLIEKLTVAQLVNKFPGFYGPRTSHGSEYKDVCFLGWSFVQCDSPCCHHYQALIMETSSTSGTSVSFYQATWRYNPEDRQLLSLLCSPESDYPGPE